MVRLQPYGNAHHRTIAKNVMISPLFAYASPFAFGTIFSTRKLSSIKIHPCRSCYNTATSAYYIYHFSLQILQSSYLAQWAQTNLMIFLISPNGLKRLIASDFSAKNTFHTEDYRHHYWTTTHEPGSGNRVVCDHTRNLKDTKVLPKSYRCLTVVAKWSCSLRYTFHSPPLHSV